MGHGAGVLILRPWVVVISRIDRFPAPAVERIWPERRRNRGWTSL